MRPVSKARARKLANSLLRQNELLTWRDMEFLTGVKAGTLNRFANSKGEWLPKNEETLKKLGLLTVRSPYAIMPRWWERTPETLRIFRYIREQATKLSNETRDEQYPYRKKRKKGKVTR